MPQNKKQMENTPTIERKKQTIKMLGDFLNRYGYKTALYQNRPPELEEHDMPELHKELGFIDSLLQEVREETITECLKALPEENNSLEGSMSISESVVRINQNTGFNAYRNEAIKSLSALRK